MKLTTFYSILTIFLLTANFSCKTESEQNEIEKQYMYVNYTVSVPDEEIDENKYIQFLEEFFSKQWEWDAFLPMLYKSDYTFVGFQDIYKSHRYYLNYKPNLIALTELSDKNVMAKIAFAAPDENDFTSVKGMYDFLIINTKEGLRLSSPFEYRLKDWEKLEVDGNIYYRPKGRAFNPVDISKMNTFNGELSEYFGTDKIAFHYYVGRDIVEVKRLQGIDFNAYMYSNDGLGGEAYPWYNFIFSGNNSEYYPHELVHIYIIYSLIDIA